jgi:thiol:disulfide interchange protein DsbA
MKRLRLLLSLLALAPVIALAQIEPRPGANYSELKPAQPVETAGKVEVIEFFWYGCPHCYSLEPALESWTKKLPADVEFKRIPAVLSANWEPHARFYYAFEALGVLERLHRPFFDALHRDHLQLDKIEAVNQWLAKNGLDPKKFAETTRSFGVSGKVKRAAQLSAAYRLDGVPLLAVHGRYTVSAEQGGSQQGMLGIAEYLINASRKDLKPAPQK